MAPSFVFVDEIDAIAGRHAIQDPRRRATFNALIAQLDGENIINVWLHVFRKMTNTITFKYGGTKGIQICEISNLPSQNIIRCAFFVSIGRVGSFSRMVCD